MLGLHRREVVVVGYFPAGLAARVEAGIAFRALAVQRQQAETLAFLVGRLATLEAPSRMPLDVARQLCVGFCRQVLIGSQ